MIEDPSSEPLTSEDVLDELELLATVGHALVVEYLSVSCALGHDLEPQDGGATSSQGRDAAATASRLAQGEMFHLAEINQALVVAGRPAQMGRASSISTAAGAEVSLDPPTADQLQQLVQREKAIGIAVDERYARLIPAVTTAHFADELLAELRPVIEAGTTHATGVGSLRDALGDPAPADALRATRRDTTDAFEQRLLDVSDRVYRLVTSALNEQFGQADLFTAGGFRSLAVSAMTALDDSHRLLVQRGLLPPFTL
jgi:hypothetical protein